MVRKISTTRTKRETVEIEVSKKDLEKLPDGTSFTPQLTTEETLAVAAVEPSPNIIFRPSKIYEYVVTKTEGKKTRTVRRWVDKPTENDSVGKDKEPPKSPVMIGITAIEVPEAEKQLKGFYLEPALASRLVRSIKEYKFIKPLGTNRR